MMTDIELIEVIGALHEWHGRVTAQLRAITENKDADLEINGDKIDAHSDVALGIRFGVALSLELLGKLPVKLNYNAASAASNADEDDCDHPWCERQRSGNKIYCAACGKVFEPPRGGL